MFKGKVVTSLLVMVLLLTLIVTVEAAEQGVTVLCYHNVGKLTDKFAVTPENLEAHFAYIRDNGYHPISLEQYVAANKGEASLPEKPVLLSFDDGYASWYTNVFPLLKKYNYPAMMAVITSMPDHYVPSEMGAILTWEQIKEMDDSGLIAFASHSHDSHRYQVVTPFGDSGQMMESFRYANGHYETDEHFKDRATKDISESQAAFLKHLGHKVKAMVWPYGSYNQIGNEIGRTEGMEAFFTLGGGFNKIGTESLVSAKRGIIMGNPDVKAFAKFLGDGGLEQRVLNGAQLDIDMIYDQNPAQFELNIEEAIRRFNDAKVNLVFLQTFSDPDGSGEIKSVYFQTDKAPVRADVFGHVSARLQNEGIWVYAWLPTLSDQWLLKDHPEDTVLAMPETNVGWYHRATPFSSNVHKALTGLVNDLAAHSNIDGILFQDDLYLNDFEDYSPAAKTVFKKETGRELTPEMLADKEVRASWTQLKTKALNDLTAELVVAAKVYHPYIKTARNLYPSLVTEPESQEWFAQNFAEYLQKYDYTVIMAYPYLEKKEQHTAGWLEELAAKALKDKTNADKVIFKLQAYDWNAKRWLSSKELRGQKSVVKSKGGIHFAYYPENVFDEP